MSAKKSPANSAQKNRRIIILSVIVLALFVAFAGLKIHKKPTPIPSPTMHEPSPIESRNLTGIYKGLMPCADCTGIDETLILAGTKSDHGTFIMEDIYQGKNVEPFQSQGNWEMAKDNIIKIIPSGKNVQALYFEILLNGDLQMLDTNMQKIDSPYNQILTKQ